ncbi:hypothetical protein CK203_030393 [Vitis vinifera]|uniref:Uncharacterized protein n=1 Tax=Vitis vinifera TaxID=29760 RepID=A0A438IV35_VITVI|nr:hypothetical protein CK203_030393 [Vitis vinifera]
MGQDERRPPLIRTLLTKSYEKLLPIIRDLSGFRWPVPIRSNPSERNRNKRCDYHKDHGHTTEACISLRYMVEDLLKAGHLKQYVQTVPKGQESPHVQFQKEKAETATSSYGSGTHELHPTGISQWEHPSHRWDIVFPTLDPARALQPHRDALILTIGVGDYDVKRISVDPSSSADLLQVAVIKRMGFKPSNLENPRRTLSGFNGSSTTSLGDVILSVQAGLVILNVLFSVVEDLSPSNAILDARGCTE